jgi:hypothetical protein
MGGSRGKINDHYKIGVCIECKVREGDSSKKKLYQCPYCKKWFCEKHIEPRLTTTKDAIERTRDLVLKEKLYEEWRRKDGHPDYIWTKQYLENLEVKEMEERRKAWKALNYLSKRQAPSKSGQIATIIILLLIIVAIIILLVLI